MGKRKDKRASRELFAQVSPTAVPPPAQNELTMMKKFRIQLLHRWLKAQIAPCHVADVGGGKGLLAYLLQQDGWQTTVIDPVAQALPAKYKDLTSGRQTAIPAAARVHRLDRPFAEQMAADFDLLIAMHAHGCNLQLIAAAQAYGRDLILLPCCVIGEPALPPAGTHWIPWLADQMRAAGFTVEPFQLNFKGQNIGLYGRAPRHLA